MGAGNSVDHQTLVSYAKQNLSDAQKDRAFLQLGNDSGGLNIMPFAPKCATTKLTKRRNKCSKCSFNTKGDGHCPMCGVGDSISENQQPNQRKSSSMFDLKQPIKMQKKKRPSLRDLQDTMKAPVPDTLPMNACYSDSTLSVVSESESAFGPETEEEDELPEPEVVSEMNQKFPYNDGWRILTRQVDTRTGTAVVHVNNKKTGYIGRFVQGATFSKTAARASIGAAHHAVQVVMPMIMSEKAAKIGACANAKAEQILGSLEDTVNHAKEVKMILIQQRVDELMASQHASVNPKGTACDKIITDLRHSTIVMTEQVKFEGGKAVIKAESDNLMHQIGICKKAISQTCIEFRIPNM